jgi:hypothetical protein
MVASLLQIYATRTQTGPAVSARRVEPGRAVKAAVGFTMENGAPAVIRTPDLLVRSQTLYPAELRARRSAKFSMA